MPEAPAPRNEEGPAPSAVGFVEAADITSFAGIIAAAVSRRDIKLKLDLERHARPIRVEPGVVEIALEPGAPSGLPALCRKRWRPGRAAAGWCWWRLPAAPSRSPSRPMTAAKAFSGWRGRTRRLQQVLARLPGCGDPRGQETTVVAETGGEAVEETGPLAD
jgi:hypothetical protein